MRRETEAWLSTNKRKSRKKQDEEEKRANKHAMATETHGKNLNAL